MKKFIAIAGCFVLSAAQAEVYKCTDANGKVTYQPTECATGTSEQVNIEAVDPNKVAEAQAKLAESLKQEEDRERAAAAAAQKERDVAAREALSSAVRNQSNALERNSQALEQANQPAVIYPSYYWFPSRGIIPPNPPFPPPRPPVPPRR